MRVLVYDKSKDIRDDFVNILIPEGFEVLTVKHVKDITKIASLIPINIAVLEVSEDDVEITTLLAKMKSEDKYKDIKIIVHIESNTKEFIASMIQLGVDGFLLKPFKKHNLYNRFKHILDNMGVEIKHLRVMEVKIKDGDSFILSFRTSKGQVITNVVNISAQCMSFRVPSDFESDFMIGEIIKNIQFDIGQKRYAINGVIKEKRDKKCVLKFDHVSEKCLDSIYKYIHETYMQNILDSKGCVK